MVSRCKCNLRSRQALTSISWSFKVVERTVIASYKLTEISTKMKFFEDGRVIEECSVLAGDTLLK
jgi:hypothetical protein